MELSRLEQELEAIFAEPTAAPPPDSSAAPVETAAPDTVELRLEYEERVNYAMEHNGVPLVRRLEVENTGTQVLEMVIIELRIDAGSLEEDHFAEPETLRLARLGRPRGALGVSSRGLLGRARPRALEAVHQQQRASQRAVSASDR